MEYRDCRFTDSTVRLDGNTFISCRFINCRLVVDGTQPGRMSSCTFENPEFHFEGAAGNTISFLSAMYRASGVGGRQAVERVFDLIRTGK